MFKPNHVITCLGDSVTEAPEGYVTHIYRILYVLHPDVPVRVVNAGFSGDRVTDMLARVDRDVIATKPDYVTISVGINDVWHDLLPGRHGVPLAEFRSAYEEILARLQAQTKARLYLMTTSVIGEDLANEPNRRLAQYNAVIRQASERGGHVLVDINAAFHDAIERGRLLNPVYQLTTDGVHPNPAGHLLYALMILKAFGMPVS